MPESQPPITEPSQGQLAEAIAAEQEIAAAAELIRRDYAAPMDRELFTKLYPLLTKPIPEAFIQRIPFKKGKPYDSTGIRSVQVQIDRMNNVLSPLWWWDEASFEEEGKLCTVTVWIGDPTLPREAETAEVSRFGGAHPERIVSRPSGAILSRSSKGGVQQGSTLGNIYKGSYTNAAKLAFARIGIGHEVYLGAADLDPDVNRDLAEREPPAATKAEVIGKKLAGEMVDRAWSIPSAKSSLQLAASHAADRDVGDCSTKAKAKEALSQLSFSQGEELSGWINRKAREEKKDG